jgi:dUTP pyrophosphatase
MMSIEKQKTRILKEETMIDVRTVVAFDRDLPMMMCETKISAMKIWDQLKMMCNILKDGGLETESIVEFKNTNEIMEVLSILYSHMPKEKMTFNVEKTLPEAILPTKAHSSDVGWDLYTPINFNLYPGETKRINFGIRIDIPDGYYIDVRNRSGIVWKYSTMMALGVGTIDTGYRGSIMAPFYNFGTEQVNFRRGDRIAQMVIKRYEDIELVEGEVETGTDRGDGGFGSSGK